MKLRIFTVNNQQPAWIQMGCGEYIKRMPKDFPLLLTEIRPESRHLGKSTKQILAAEKDRLDDCLNMQPGARLIVLDERGCDLTTSALSKQLENWTHTYSDISFVIGSADGLDPALKARANDMLRLSSFTLPHGLACLVLCEQIYRAVSIIKQHPYHRQ